MYLLIGVESICKTHLESIVQNRCRNALILFADLQFAHFFTSRPHLAHSYAMCLLCPSLRDSHTSHSYSGSLARKRLNMASAATGLSVATMCPAPFTVAKVNTGPELLLLPPPPPPLPLPLLAFCAYSVT